MQGAIPFKEDVLRVRRSCFRCVILSAAKGLRVASEILRCAQNDKAR